MCLLYDIFTPERNRPYICFSKYLTKMLSHLTLCKSFTGLQQKYFSFFNLSMSSHSSSLGSAIITFLCLVTMISILPNVGYGNLSFLLSY